jgi:hypothetical protein
MLLALAAVHATLLKPLPTHASVGAKFTVSFALRDAAGHPVDAKSVFVKVICPEKDVWTVAFATDVGHGRYRAVATVPAGGLGRIRIGHGGTFYPVRS